jgi:hypothetical protein
MQVVKLRKVGNSMTVTLPASVVVALHVHENGQEPHASRAGACQTATARQLLTTGLTCDGSVAARRATRMSERPPNSDRSCSRRKRWEG